MDALKMAIKYAFVNDYLLFGVDFSSITFLDLFQSLSPPTPVVDRLIQHQVYFHTSQPQQLSILHIVIS